MKSFVEIMEEIKNIIALQSNKKKILDKDVAQSMGISQLNFATLKKRGTIPFNELLDFCAKRSISINYLLYGQSPESLVDTTNRVFMVKYLYSVNASAGGGAEDSSLENEQIALPSSFIPLLGGESELKNIEAINVSGDSMEPTLSYYDIVFINRTKTTLQNGSIYVLQSREGLLIKRVELLKDGVVKIISDNDIYKPIIIKEQDIKVVGKVVSKLGSVS